MYFCRPTRSISNGRFELEHAEIVQGAERDDEIEVLVAPRIRILRTVAEQIGANRLRRVGEAVLRDVEAGDVRARQ